MSEKTYYIYKITNQLSGKIYIGQSVEPERRWKTHQRYARTLETNQYIHKAMHKYGVNNFEFEIISQHESREEANQVEHDLISEYKTRNKEFGYNLKPGGYKRGGWKHSEETKAKQKARWHKVHTPESIRKTAEANRGRKHSKETRRKMSESSKKSLHDANYKKGRTRPKAEIEKAAITMAERYGSKVCNAPRCERTDGYKHEGIRYCEMHVQRLIKTGTLNKKQRSEWARPKPRSEETRRKLSEALKGREPHNKISFSDKDIELIMSYTISGDMLAKKFGVSRNVIKRVRRENKS